MKSPSAIVPAAPRAPRRRRGLTLIEAALVLAVVALVFGGFAQMLSDASENLRARNAADRVKEIAKVSEAYVNARVSAFRALPVGTVTAVPVAGNGTNASFPGLIQSGYLASTYNDDSAYHQRHVLLVKTQPPAASCQPVTDPATGQVKPCLNRVEALVTSIPITGKSLIPLRQRGRVAQMVGARGGSCQGNQQGSDGCSVIRGVAGGWTAAVGDWSSQGMMATVGSIQATVPVADTAVLSDYLNRNDIGDPEANTMHTTIIASPPSGQYAMEQDPNSGNTVLKIGPDVSVPGYVQAGNYIKSGTNCADTGAPGDVVACNNVVGSKFVDRDSPAFFVDPNQKSNLQDAKLAKMDINDMVVYTTGNDGDRLAGNQTVRLRDLLPRFVSKDGFAVTQGNSDVEVPVCPGNGQAKVFLSPMQESWKFDLAKYIAAQKLPGYVYNSQGATNPHLDQAVTSINCAGDTCNYNTSSFAKGDDLTYAQGINDIAFGKLSNFRQYTAGQPFYNGVTNKYYWHVDMPSAADQPQAADGSITQPMPWKALAMTYCYY